ncbi:MAG: nucleotidyltransferase domain-containing protein [Candidatus Hydrogenedentota bacterium]|nr:MAG: nucleotidyltransferase domain-containing protein [Candidatus Hydrogenedentota bacterium]
MIHCSQNILPLQAIISKTKEILSPIPVQHCWLFGSYAENIASESSDLDFIIVYKTKKKFFDRFLDFENLYSTFPVAIDILPYTPQEWQEISKRPFFSKVLKNAIQILQIYL